jgi:hypothetical protein
MTRLYAFERSGLIWFFFLEPAAQVMIVMVVNSASWL